MSFIYIDRVSSFCYYNPEVRARSSAWLEHTSDKGKVPGSNPGAPTKMLSTSESIVFLLEWK